MRSCSTDEPIKLVKDSKIRRVVMCSGKVYYDLYEEREKRGINDIYLLRVEQLYPFPAKALITELSRFRNAEMAWCQEEPKNMGAWSFIDPYLEWVLAHIDAKHQRVRYTGRPASASPATGMMSKHLQQLAVAARRTRSANRRTQQGKRTRPMATEIRVPTLGESVTEATIGKWFKKAGDTVAVDEPLVELETDKVTVEVPSPAAGVLADITAKDGETVGVGALLGNIDAGAGAKPARKGEGSSPATNLRRSRRRQDRPARPLSGKPRSRPPKWRAKGPSKSARCRRRRQPPSCSPKATSRSTRCRVRASAARC